MDVPNPPYKLAKISSGKELIVFFDYWNPKKHRFQRFKHRHGLNKKNVSLADRKQLANDLVASYNANLRKGWSPFEQIDEPAPTEVKESGQSSKVIATVEGYIELKKNTLRRRTWQSYKYSFDVFKAWLEKNNLGKIGFRSLKPNHIRQFHDDLIKSGDYANKSINNHIGNIKVLFSMAVERELIDKNPFSKIEMLPVEVGKNFPYNEKQKKALKKAILKEDKDLWPFVKMIYHCFLRPVEILRMKVTDFNAATNQFIMHSGTSKNKKQMGVEVPQSFIDEVRSWKLEQYPPNYYIFGYKLKPGPKPYGRNAVTMRHSAISDSLGIPQEYSMYSWKHTGNVDSYKAGVSVPDLMRQNRHHSLEETMGYLRSLGLMPNIEYSTKAPKL